MADENALTLDVGSWIDPKEWAEANELVRKRFLAAVCPLIVQAKRRQVLAGKGADNKPLEARKRPRADGAKGKPLDPHGTRSRAYVRVRCVPAHKSGCATLFWSHGWGKVMGYHAQGKVIGAPVRDLIGFPPTVVTWLKGEVRREWRKHHVLAMPAKRKAPSVPVPPTPVSIAARPKGVPKVVYLKPGEKPKILPGRIQVYTTRGR